MLGEGDWLENRDGVTDGVIDTVGVMDADGDTVGVIDEVGEVVGVMVGVIDGVGVSILGNGTTDGGAPGAELSSPPCRTMARGVASTGDVPALSASATSVSNDRTDTTEGIDERIEEKNEVSCRHVNNADGRRGDEENAGDVANAGVDADGWEVE